MINTRSPNPRRVLLMLDFDETLCPHNSAALLDSSHVDDPLRVEEIAKARELLISGTMTPDGYAGLLYLKALRPHKQDLENLGQDIADRFIGADKFLFVEEMKQRFEVVIVSGGIKELVKPTARKMGVNFFCVALEYDHEGYFFAIKANGFEVDKYIGIGENIERSTYDDIVMIGDGENDYRVWQNGICTDYICYTEYREASFAKDLNEKKAKNLEELRKHLSHL